MSDDVTQNQRGTTYSEVGVESHATLSDTVEDAVPTPLRVTPAQQADPLQHGLRVTRFLPVPLTLEDRSVFAVQQEMSGAQLAALETELETTTRRLSRQISDLKTRLHQATLVLRHGEQLGPVFCEQRVDWKSGFVRIVRLDDETTVESRSLTPVEMAARPGA